MGVITLNGVSSAAIGLQVETPPDYEIAERLYETTHIPGRDGDLVMDTGAFKNVTRSYEVSIGEENGNFSKLAHKISGWLHSAPGYIRLEDSYEPEVFKLVKYSEECNILNILQQAGRATLTFDRKPQRFLKTGEDKVVVNSSRIVNNPTFFDSKPLIKVNGNGNGLIHVGIYDISIEGLSGYMYIDSELEDAYKEALNTNNNVTVPKGFPLLKSGDNSIAYSGGITSLEITPRWWTI